MERQTQIYIRGFPKSTTQNDLRNHFSEYNSIEGVRIIKDYAFIVNEQQNIGF
jgi:RNA recognition motif-containing protein